MVTATTHTRSADFNLNLVYCLICVTQDLAQRQICSKQSHDFDMRQCTNISLLLAIILIIIERSYQLFGNRKQKNEITICPLYEKLS